MAVAALQESWSSAFGRRAFACRNRIRLPAACGPVVGILLGLLLAGSLELATAPTAWAQVFTYNPRPPKPVTARPANDGQMLVQANEVD